MHPRPPRSLLRPLCVGLALVAGAYMPGCPATVEQRPTPSVPGPDTPAPRTARPPLPGPSKATCDPATCPVFCFKAACGVDRDTCEAGCRRVCGDGYFDDRDGPVMACTLGARGDACAALERCCEIDYTSQLCEIAPIAR